MRSARGWNAKPARCGRNVHARAGFDTSDLRAKAVRAVDFDQELEVSVSRRIRRRRRDRVGRDRLAVTADGRGLPGAIGKRHAVQRDTNQPGRRRGRHIRQEPHYELLNEVRGPISDIRRPKSEVRSPKSEVRGSRSEVRSPRSDIDIRYP